MFQTKEEALEAEEKITRLSRTISTSLFLPHPRASPNNLILLFIAPISVQLSLTVDDLKSALRLAAIRTLEK